MTHHGELFDIVIVDDGSADNIVAVLRELRANQPRLRVVRHATQYGQSAAILTGVRFAAGAWIATVDGDGQDDPRDIPRMLDAGRARGHGRSVLVTGARVHRHDALGRRWTTYVMNRWSAVLLKHPLVDKGGGLKLFRRADFLRLPVFDHMHRFLPALFHAAGAEIFEIPVNHRPRRHGQSHYANLPRLWQSFVDGFGVRWLARRMVDPAVLDSGRPAGETDGATP
jgi:glycosyltransferase involved in cell wall biosynthesis